MKTTLNEIRRHSPCYSSWVNLLKHLGKTKPDGTPLSLLTILESNGFQDTLWCLRAVKGHDRTIKRYLLWCADRLRDLADTETIEILDRTIDFVDGRASPPDLDSNYRVRADRAIYNACLACVYDWSDVRAPYVVSVCANAAQGPTASELTAQAEELRRVIQATDNNQDPYPKDPT
ncbi:MAG: hypothetical protein JJU29_10515 [Verrucomicrobia bacterium]|nr:hypothetical protein [Verrucomicrobiota bacterium]